MRVHKTGSRRHARATANLYFATHHYDKDTVLTFSN